MEPIIVTFFYDVGRGQDSYIPRSNTKYYKEFAEWARIKNRLIVFTDKESENEIIGIRNKYGLKDRTKVVVIDDLFSIEKEMYNRMEKIALNPDFLNSRYQTYAMENKAKYTYAWMIKYWCISEASKMIEDNELIAWFDFGFNHMDVCYSDMNEFSFLWTIKEKVDRIRVYSFKDINEVHAFNSYQYLSDNIMGVFYLVPKELAMKFWELVRDAMKALIALECIDDDQQLVLMAIKAKPEIFDVRISNYWYLCLKENGAEHLSVKLKQETLKDKYRVKKRYFKTIRGFLIREFKLSRRYFHNG